MEQVQLRNYIAVNCNPDNLNYEKGRPKIDLRLPFLLIISNDML